MEQKMDQVEIDKSGVEDSYISLWDPRWMETVHTRHCCVIHGCKYGYDHPDREGCPVSDGIIQQSRYCEQCEDMIYGCDIVSSWQRGL
jgi:hypothetical protein